MEIAKAMEILKISAAIVTTVSLLQVVNSRCDTHFYENITKIAYYGWPLTLSCADFIDVVEIGDGLTIQCIISDRKSRNILYNATQYINEYDDYYSGYFLHFTTDVTENSPTQFDMTLMVNGSCTTNIVTISPTHLRKVACDLNFRNHSHRARPRQGESTFTLYCQDSDGRQCSPESHTYWLHNCNRNLPNDTYKDGYGNLVLKDVSYEHHLGVFTCACEYNGKARYIVTYDPCIYLAENPGLTVKCSDQTSLQIGENATAECTVDAGVGHFDSYMYSAKIDKQQKSEDSKMSASETKCFGGNIESRDLKASPSCVIKDGTTKGDESKGNSCLRRKPTQEEIKASVTRFRIFFTIRNLKPSDFGSYHVEVSYLNSLTATTVFSLVDDSTTEETLHNLLYAILLSVAVLMLSLLIWIFRVEVSSMCWMNCKSQEKGTKQNKELKQIQV